MQIPLLLFPFSTSIRLITACFATNRARYFRYLISCREVGEAKAERTKISLFIIKLKQYPISSLSSFKIVFLTDILCRSCFKHSRKNRESFASITHFYTKNTYTKYLRPVEPVGEYRLVYQGSLSSLTDESWSDIVRNTRKEYFLQYNI